MVFLAVICHRIEVDRDSSHSSRKGVLTQLIKAHSQKNKLLRNNKKQELVGMMGHAESNFKKKLSILVVTGRAAKNSAAETEKTR